MSRQDFSCHNRKMCRLWKLGRETKILCHDRMWPNGEVLCCDKEFHVTIELGHGRRFPCRDLIF